MVIGGRRARTRSRSSTRANLGAGWRRRASLPQARRNTNSVLTPDGAVITIGGNLEDNYISPQKEALRYDPAADAWTPLAAQAEERGYHSTALLLPDGRIISAGDDGPSDLGGAERRDRGLLAALPLQGPPAADHVGPGRGALRVGVRRRHAGRRRRQGGAGGAGRHHPRQRHAPAAGAAGHDADGGRPAADGAGEHVDRAAGPLHAVPGQLGGRPLGGALRPPGAHGPARAAGPAPAAAPGPGRRHDRSRRGRSGPGDGARRDAGPGPSWLRSRRGPTGARASRTRSSGIPDAARVRAAFSGRRGLRRRTRRRRSRTGPARGHATARPSGSAAAGRA